MFIKRKGTHQNREVQQISAGHFTLHRLSEKCETIGWHHVSQTQPHWLLLWRESMNKEERSKLRNFFRDHGGKTLEAIGYIVDTNLSCSIQNVGNMSGAMLASAWQLNVSSP